MHYVKKPFGAGVSTIALIDVSDSRCILDESQKAKFDTTESGFEILSSNLKWSANASVMRVHGRTESGDGAFELTFKRQAPLMAYNGTGYFPLLNNELATYEYGFPTMDASGTVTANGKRYSVSGNGWFDRQWFNVAKAETLASGDTRWIWISMKLSNGETVAVWSATGKRERSWADILHADGSHTIADVKPISKSHFGLWRSSKSGIIWPSGWNVEIPGVQAKLKVTFAFQGQETFANFNRVEGVIHVEGCYGGQDVTGRGCGEIVGDPKIKQ